MATNYEINVPSVFETLAYDADFEPPLRGLDITAAGTLFVVDTSGNAATYDLTGITVPYRLVLNIASIVGDGAGSIGDGATGTDIALANLVGLV